jgi:hypothetical protein
VHSLAPEFFVHRLQHWSKLVRAWHSSVFQTLKQCLRLSVVKFGLLVISEDKLVRLLWHLRLQVGELLGEGFEERLDCVYSEGDVHANIWKLVV